MSSRILTSETSLERLPIPSDWKEPSESRIDEHSSRSPAPLSCESALAQARPVVRRDGKTRSIGRIDVLENPALALKRWETLETLCPGAFYQSRAFALPWLAAYAKSFSIAPMLVIAHNSAGEPVAFLPFGVRRRGIFSVAEFLGGKDSNANMGLFRPGVAFEPDDLISLLKASAAKSRFKPDLFLLTNQPSVWEGAPNPLDIFPHQGSASYLHGGALGADPQAFMKERLSKDTAKKLRAKRRKLEATGDLTHVTAADPAMRRKIIVAFFEQKLARFREKHIGSIFETPQAREFLETAHALEWHALMLNERILATYGGAAHRGRLQLMVNSFDADPEIARSSPGDLLLQSILEQKCAQGLASFDLGIGEARYKESWCNESVAMFDSILPASRLGRFYAAVESSRLGAKRWVKQSDWAMPFAMRLLGRK